MPNRLTQKDIDATEAMYNQAVKSKLSKAAAKLKSQLARQREALAAAAELEQLERRSTK